MNELVLVLEQIFEAETGAGNKLEGVKVLTDYHDGMAEQTLAIEEVEERLLSGSWELMHVLGEVSLVAWSAVSKTATAAAWKTQRTAARDMAMAVVKIVGENPALTCDDFPDGVTQNPVQTRITRIVPVAGSMERGAEFAGVRLVLNVEYLLRRGELVLR